MADLQVNSLWLMADSSRALDFSKFMEKSMTQLETISRCDIHGEQKFQLSSVDQDSMN